MDLNTAFRNAIRAYFEGQSPDELNGTQKRKSKYDKKYLDKMGEDMLGEKYSPKEFDY